MAICVVEVVSDRNEKHEFEIQTYKYYITKKKVAFELSKVMVVVNKWSARYYNDPFKMLVDNMAIYNDYNYRYESYNSRNKLKGVLIRIRISYSSDQMRWIGRSAEPHSSRRSSVGAFEDDLEDSDPEDRPFFASCVVEVVSDQSDRHEFEINTVTTKIDRKKVALELSKFMVNKAYLVSNPFWQFVDNMQIYDNRRKKFVNFRSTVHELNGSRLRITYPAEYMQWISIIVDIEDRPHSATGVKNYIRFLRTLSANLIPQSRDQFVDYIRSNEQRFRKACSVKSIKDTCLDQLWLVVEEANKHCDEWRKSKATIVTEDDIKENNNNSENLASNEISFDNTAGDESDVSEDTDSSVQNIDEDVVSTSSLASNSVYADYPVLCNTAEEDVIDSSDDEIDIRVEMQRKRKKMMTEVTEEEINYYLVLCLNKSLADSSEDLWKRVSNKLSEEFKYNEMTETETHIRFYQIFANYLKVLKSAKSPLEASLAFIGFDLLNTTDLSSLLTPIDNQLISQLKTNLSPSGDTSVRQMGQN